MTKPRISEKVRSLDYENMMVEITPSHRSGVLSFHTNEAQYKTVLEEWAREVEAALSDLRSFHGTSVTVVGVEEFDACSVCNDRWEPWDEDGDKEWNGTDKVNCASCGAEIKQD